MVIVIIVVVIIVIVIIFVIVIVSLSIFGGLPVVQMMFFLCLLGHSHLRHQFQVTAGLSISIFEAFRIVFGSFPNQFWIAFKSFWTVCEHVRIVHRPLL